MGNRDGARAATSFVAGRATGGAGARGGLADWRLRSAAPIFSFDLLRGRSVLLQRSAYEQGRAELVA